MNINKDSFQNFVKYLEDIACVTLGLDKNVLKGILALPENIEKLEDYIRDARLEAIFLNKVGQPPPDLEEGKKIPFQLEEKFDLELSFSCDFKDYTTGIALTKVSPKHFLSHFNTNKVKLCDMIKTVQTGGGNPYKLLHSYVATVLEPYFLSFIKVKGERNQPTKKKKSIPEIVKHIDKLKLTLYQCQETFHIPQIEIEQFIHKDIKKALNESIVGEKLSFKFSMDAVAEMEQYIAQLGKEIRKIVEHFNEDPEIPNTISEINYWTNLDVALKSLKERINSKEIETTLSALKHHGKNKVTLVFEDYKNSLYSVSQKASSFYRTFIKDLPIFELKSCKNLSDLEALILKVFAQLKKIKNCEYPINRAFQLIKAICGDIIEQIIKILETYALLDLKYNQFDKASTEVVELFGTLATSRDTLTGILKGKEDTGTKTDKDDDEQTIKLETRINEIRNFRREHNELYLVIKKVFSPESFKLSDNLNPLEKIAYAYENCSKLGTKLLDITSEGERNFKATMKKYNENIQSVEKIIITTIRNRLGSAKNASESFRVFGQFNALFYKEGIRNSVDAYRKNLIDQVKQDISNLEDTFKHKFEKSDVYKLNDVKSLPPISSQIIWAKQIEKQLDIYVKRIEAVVGKGWERLSHLRRDVSWVLSESLAQVMKIPLSKLQNAIRKIKVFKKAKPEIIGTAIVIAYLFIVFPESKSEWEEMVEESKAQLEKDEKELGIFTGSSITHADSLLKEELNLEKRQQKELIERCNRIKERLQTNVEALMDKWNKDVVSALKNGSWKILKLGTNNDQTDSVIIDGDIFTIVEAAEQKDSNIKQLDLKVNFHQGVIDLLHEYRVFSQPWTKLRDKVAKLIMKTVVNALDIYPFYLNFNVSINSYKRMVVKITENIKPLAAGNMKRVENLLEKGLGLSWKKIHTLQKYAQTLANEIHNFQNKITILLQRNTSIKESLGKLKDCKYSQIKTHITEIQVVVDDMNLEKSDYSNLKQWVTKLNEKVEDILSKRLIKLVNLWKKHFLALNSDLDISIDSEKNDYFSENPLKPFKGQIKLINKVLRPVPSALKIKIFWYSELHKCFSAICNIPKIMSGRFDVADEGLEIKAATYSYLLTKIPHDTVREMYQLIDEKMGSIDVYINKWLDYQALYNIDSFSIASQLGGKLDSWMELLNGIKNARKESESEDAQKDFGAVIINFKDIQSKIQLKYDKTLKDMLKVFREKLGKKGKEFFNTICTQRKRLESINLESLDEGVVFLQENVKIAKNIDGWEKLMDSLVKGEQMIEKNRVKLKEGWIYAERIKSEWMAFLDIYNLRQNSMKLIKPKLVEKMKKGFKDLKDVILSLLQSWRSSKPIGKEEPHVALKILNEFDTKIEVIKKKMENIQVANKILNLDLEDVESDIKPIEEEIGNLRTVWKSLEDYYSELKVIKDSQLRAILPKKIKRTLESFLDEIKKTSSWMQSYQPVMKFKEIILNYRKTIPLIDELRTEAMERKHWEELKKRLNVFWNVSELTIGDLWKVDMMANETIFQEIITVAKGELVLRVFLRETAEKWADLKFTLVNFNNRCFLIKGWEDFFEELNDSLKSLSSTRASPYFKAFKEQLISWETKLSTLNFICDIWMDVQRVWVYLEGVFIGNKDIKAQLPQETQKFRIIDREFVSLMRKIHKNPVIIDIFEIPNIQKQLEKIHGMLLKIQKSLGEYLEKQRQAFPRFYFVGDEDLLEIIGHTGDPYKVQKHLKKMFAGINQLQIKEEEKEKDFRIIGMSSKEGEEVLFKDPVQMNPDIKINEWLTNVEKQMKISLANLLQKSVTEVRTIYEAGKFDGDEFKKWVEAYQVQLVVVSVQIVWTKFVEDNLNQEGLKMVLKKILGMLESLAGLVLNTKTHIERIKIEYLITELVHQRDVVRKLISQNVESKENFDWMYWMRFYIKKDEPFETMVQIKIANASFYYGFEYLGLTDKLVQTPLTDRVYTALTQALYSRQGGSPFGPAGTGKTETVKMLGAQLGRLCIVFNCDETFDFKAMGRIFVGLCQCGAWGCFDEFNRLNEKILSAVSQQILTIQRALRDDITRIELIGRKVNVQGTTGIFITMNPGYAGRSQLPQNLKQLFRSIAMVKPDQEIIAEVIMFSQGFVYSEKLAKKIVLFFNLCKDELSQQSHYDFGLRALKNVLVNAGNLKRKESINSLEKEQTILIQSVLETVIPKLVGTDKDILKSLLLDLFPGANLELAKLSELKKTINEIAESNNLIASDSWMEKIIQLYQIQNISHGVILVGKAGIGKTTSWKTLIEAIEKTDEKKRQSISYIINPKAITKEELYGNLDATTREWTDGIFTSILRKIVDDHKGESDQRHFIVFDGDVDPEWVENLNSVLDCNKLFTLPNGERLSIPPNVRIFFEVRNLDYATLATVSRCGMVWYGEGVVTNQMIMQNFIQKLLHVPLSSDPNLANDYIAVQSRCADVLKRYFKENGIVERVVRYAQKKNHVMKYAHPKALTSSFHLLQKGIMDIYEYEVERNVEMEEDHLDKYLTKRLLFSLFWGIGSSMLRQDRTDFSEFLKTETIIPVPEGSMLDYEPLIGNGEWGNWKDRVQFVDVGPRSIITGAVIPTSDTLRHTELLVSWIKNKRCVILCGPPGSGKTMILTAVLKELHNFIAVPLNFSSATSPELILKTFEQHCAIMPTPDGLVLRPVNDKNLVVFCDEINLPANDNYGTQRVVTFMRQIVEQKGYWRASDRQWIKVDKIYFVGACNPPTDPGRVVMTPRFLRHSGVLYVDFPGYDSLIQIYGTFVHALSKLGPVKGLLDGIEKNVTQALVNFYTASQQKFTTQLQPHYIYSPRELSRYMRALYEGIEKGPSRPNLQDFIRLLAHEGLRIFADRLVLKEEKDWTIEKMDEIIRSHFPNVEEETLERPILFTFLYEKNAYVTESRDTLKQFIQEKMNSFAEEQLDTRLVLFDSVLEHVLRIDRVLRQPLGHLLLAGVSGAGKTVLPRFVSWLIGYEVFQIKAHSKYLLTDFEEDLRKVLKETGINGKKICFIFDESNILDPAFLEYMNALLASGEVPGLFEDEELAALISQLKSANQSAKFETDEELYQWFIEQVQKNLHIVFTINPVGSDFKNRQTTSPALFNRCVVDWFGDWSDEGLTAVGKAFTRDTDLKIMPTPSSIVSNDDLEIEEGKNDVLISSLLKFHNTVKDISLKLSKTGKRNFVTPRDFLDFITHFNKLFSAKVEQLKGQQSHLDNGLGKLESTEQEVALLKSQLELKRKELDAKNKVAQEKLQQIVKDQQVAEQRKQEGEALTVKLEQKGKAITVRKAKAEEDLSKVKPMLEEAKNAVSGIKKAYLDELRVLGKPPTTIKKVLEAVVVLLEGKAKIRVDWTAIRGRLKRANFIKDVLQFDSRKITDGVKKRVQKMSSTISVEAAQRSSKACGPLAKWIFSQIQYAEILLKVEPLRQEIEEISKENIVLVNKQKETQEELDELRTRIESFEKEYKVLIHESTLIKHEMESVKEKVDRSIQLLSSLSSESGRWKQQSKEFFVQLENVAGDCIFSAAFLTYIGNFEEHLRKSIRKEWKVILHAHDIKHTKDFNVIGYLTDAKSRLYWKANDLPVDDLYVENAIMLDKYNRYPLVVDPTGTAVQFLQNIYKSKKIVKTSFLDPGFLKNLETSLRFGTPLLVEDAEKIDPILNPVLNREIIRHGGRNLVRLASQDIDFSDNFRLFMSTRDPTFEFSVDLMSRVTMINFTVTPASLQTQCLNIIMKSERPDIEKQRNEQLKLQGEYDLKLRNLENDLLNAISNAKGNLLENEKLLSTLENLKKSSIDIAKKVEMAEENMKKFEQVRNSYVPLASYCSKIYFSLEMLQDIHFLYQFSLEFFLDCLKKVLEKRGEEIEVLIQKLFRIVFHRTARGLIHKDRIILALKFCEIFLEGTQDEIPKEEYNLLLTSGKLFPQLIKLDDELGLSTTKKQLLTEASKVQAFESIGDYFNTNIDEVKTFLNSRKVPESVPECWDKSNSKIVNEFRKVFIVKTLKTEFFIHFAEKFIETVFGKEFYRIDINLEQVVLEENKAHTPILMISLPGFDASTEVHELSWQCKKQLKAIAMGSSEGYEIADIQVPKAIKNGTWILLKNVHLSPSYLIKIEKLIHKRRSEKRIHEGFRLFLSAEVHKSIPVNLLRQSMKIVYEPAPGVKANMMQSFSALNKQIVDREPMERGKLYVLAAWFHAVIQERLRFVPLGWSKYYEFTQGDLKWSFDAIDKWVDLAARGSSNILPSKLPWKALKSLIGESIYGGKLDNIFDSKILKTFIEKFFSPKCYEEDFKFFEGKTEKDHIFVPSGVKFDDFNKWIDELPSGENPEWMGLPSNVRLMTLTKKAHDVLRNLVKIQDTRGSFVGVGGDTNLEGELTSSLWKPIKNTVSTWKEILPKSLDAFKLQNIQSDSHLFRCFSREITSASQLLETIHKDIDQLILVADGQIKPNKNHWYYNDCIKRQIVPTEWKAYEFLDTITLNEFVSDFSKRVKQSAYILERIMKNDFCKDTISLGLLLFPEAYISATRQDCAHSMKKALETLTLKVQIGDDLKLTGTNEFILHGGSMSCAKWKDGKIEVSPNLENPCPPMKFTWVSSEDQEKSSEQIQFPLYLNKSRKHLLCGLELPSNVEVGKGYLRGISFISWNVNIQNVKY